MYAGNRLKSNKYDEQVAQRGPSSPRRHDWYAAKRHEYFPLLLPTHQLSILVPKKKITLVAHVKWNSKWSPPFYPFLSSFPLQLISLENFVLKIPNVAEMNFVNFLEFSIHPVRKVPVNVRPVSLTLLQLLHAYQRPLRDHVTWSASTELPHLKNVMIGVKRILHWRC